MERLSGCLGISHSDFNTFSNFQIRIGRKAKSSPFLVFFKLTIFFPRFQFGFIAGEGTVLFVDFPPQISSPHASILT